MEFNLETTLALLIDYDAATGRATAVQRLMMGE